MTFAFVGTTEIVIILVVALIVFGPQKLPEIGRQVGSAMRELQRVRNDVQRALDLDDYTRLDAHPYDAPSYGSTYATTNSGYGASHYNDENGDYPSLASYEGADMSASFVAPPGPPALRAAQTGAPEAGAAQTDKEA